MKWAQSVKIKEKNKSQPNSTKPNSVNKQKIKNKRVNKLFGGLPKLQID
jgi:hypothetical protein